MKEFETIAEGISQEDRNLILSSFKGVRRSKIEVVQDDKTQKQSPPPQVRGKRRYVKHAWPKAETEVTLKNPWTQQKLTAEVVSNPKLKNGVEFKLGRRRFNSPSKLCEAAFGKRVANGWNHISW